MLIQNIIFRKIRISFRTATFLLCLGLLFFAFTTSVYATTYYWVGGITNSNTSNPANWNTIVGVCADSANATAPTTGDTIRFVSNCLNNATVDSALSVANFYMDLGYTGTVSNASTTITVSSSGGLRIEAGTLNVTNGAIINTTGTVGIGIGTGSNGTVIINGTGSRWTNSGELRVGDSGTGVLNILNGGTVSNTGGGRVGYNAGSSGTITVDGTGSIWTNSVELQLGKSGTGVLNILNGGTVSNTGGRVGYNAGSSGTVTVDGAGSTWTNSSDIQLGKAGTGILNILNGGAVSNTAVYIGYAAGSNGTATVSGAGSTWTNSTNIIIGKLGTGSLTISNSGVVNVASGAGTATLANAVGSVGTLNIGSGYTTDLVQAASITAGLGTAAFPPITTTTITGAAVSGTSIAWDWTDETGATGYKVYRASDNTLLVTISSATSNWTQDSLSANTSSSIYYRGTNANGEGAASASVSAYTLADTPTNLSATLNSNNITLTIDSLSNATSGSSGYYFSRSGANSGWIQTNSWQDTEVSCVNSYITYSGKYRNGDGIETDSLSTTTSSNRCGGGGLPSGYSNPPTSPAEGFNLSINSGAESSSSSIVTLNLKGGSDTVKMVISNFSDFRDVGQESYANTKTWNLCQGLTTCTNGTYTVYAKFYTTYGQTSETVLDSIVLNSSAIVTPPASSIIVNPVSPLIGSMSAILFQIYSQRPDLQQFYDVNGQAKNLQDSRIKGIPTLNDWYQKYGIKEYAQVGLFTLTLRLGSRNQQVIWLQDLLKQLGFFPSTVKSTSYFGLITRQAVQKLQCQYKIICSGNELTTGYGLVGPKTMQVLNSLNY